MGKYIFCMVQSFRNPYAFQVSERSMVHYKCSETKHGLLQTFRNVPTHWYWIFQGGTFRKFCNKPLFISERLEWTMRRSETWNAYGFRKLWPWYLIFRREFHKFINFVKSCRISRLIYFEKQTKDHVTTTFAPKIYRLPTTTNKK